VRWRTLVAANAAFAAAREARALPAQFSPPIIEFLGRWYFMHHNGGVQPTGGSFRRSVCIDYLHHNPDGTIKRMVQTAESVSPATK
jgi:hypothetical protein